MKEEIEIENTFTWFSDGRGWAPWEAGLHGKGVLEGEGREHCSELVGGIENKEGRGNIPMAWRGVE